MKRLMLAVMLVAVGLTQAEGKKMSEAQAWIERDAKREKAAMEQADRDPRPTLMIDKRRIAEVSWSGSADMGSPVGRRVGITVYGSGISGGTWASSGASAVLSQADALALADWIKRVCDEK